MSWHDEDPGPIALCIVVVVAVLIYGVAIFGNAKACERRGGRYVRAVWSFACVKAQP